MWAPDNSAACPSSSFASRHGVFKDQTFIRLHGWLAGAAGLDGLIDRLESRQVDVRKRLSPALGNSGVISADDL